MAKQLNVNLAMTADTSKARQELQSLQKSLTDILNTAAKGGNTNGFGQQFKDAIADVAQLKAQLTQATNAAGQLDITKFADSLKKSGTSLDDYRKKLSNLGSDGRQAFQQLASSILSAETPLKRTNGLLTEFMTSLKNTARWQISSSILHGFMGALQSAYGYAQDLNESLNNIRIVTGQSIDEMSRFADEANKAARELSTTTTAYTDASLIYYQQGLNAEEVAKRTEVTIKMANASRQSAEEVSNQLTAIWNNFDDGTASLEYYADVITALGAATASSSQEIATGLEKFSAIAETVGLSYEYATAALATVTAETRQSADVVGTAFKSLFARIQQLKLGDTLEDGTDLGKYSEALDKIGISIKDANDEVKDMDVIIDELGEKWNTLSKDVQIAVAQTVAGQRQYAQLMSLLNNYDTFKENVDIARGSEGTLQKQADIYAESWEAASKRVRAAAQGIYQDLISDEFFITMLNGIEKVLGAIDKMIAGLGGLKGLLATVAALVTQIFSSQIANGIQSIIDGINRLRNGAQIAAETKQQALDSLNSMVQQGVNSGTMGTNEGASTTAALQAQYEVQQTLLNNAKNMTEEQRLQAQYMLDTVAAAGKRAVEEGKIADAIEKETAALERSVRQLAVNSTQKGVESIIQVKKSMEEYRVALESAYTQQENFINQIRGIENLDGNGLQNFITNLESFGVSLGLNRDQVEYFSAALKECFNDDGTIDATKLNDVLDELQENLINAASGADSVNAALVSFKEAMSRANIPAEKQEEIINNLTNQYKKNREAADGVTKSNKELSTMGQKVSSSINGMHKEVLTFSNSLSQITGIAMAAYSAINSFKNIGRIWSDEDMDTGEKILQTFGALVGLLPTLTMLTKTDKIEWLAAAGARLIHTTNTTANTVAETANTTAKYGAAAANGVLAASMTPILVMLGLITVAVIALVGAIYLIAEAIKKAQDSSPEKQLENAKKATEEFTKAEEDAIQKAEDLKTAFDNYTSVVDHLHECSAGTDEWNEALQDVNDTVIDIMNKYPELVSMMGITTDAETGALQITNWNEVLDYANRQAQQAKLNTLSSQEISTGREVALQEKNVLDKSYQDYYGIDVQQAIEDVKNGIIPQTIDELEKYVNRVEYDDNGINERYRNNQNKALQDLFDDLQSLGAASQNAAKSIDTMSYTISSFVVSNNAKDKGYNLSGEEQSAIANITSGKYYTDLQNNYSNLLNQKNSDGQDVWQKYLDTLSQEERTAITSNATYKNGEYSYSVMGQSEPQTMSYEMVAQAVAAAEALGNLATSADGVTEKFMQLSGDQKELVTGLANNKDENGNFDAKEYIKENISGFDLNKNIPDMLNMSRDDIEEVAETLGMTYNDLMKEINNSIGEVQRNFNMLGSDIKNSNFQDYYNAKKTNMTYDEAQDFLQAYNNTGKSQYFGGFAETYGTEAASQLGNIDFSQSAASIKSQIESIFTNANIPVPDDINNWVIAFKNANAAAADGVPTIEGLGSRLDSLDKLEELHFGDIITPEDYELLTQMNPALADFFQNVDTGYQLMANGNLAAETMRREEQANIYNQLDTANQENIQHWQDYGEESESYTDTANNLIGEARDLSELEQYKDILNGEGWGDSTFLDAYKEKFTALAQEALPALDSLEQFKTIEEGIAEYDISNIDYSQLASGLIELAQNYDNTVEESRKFTEAIASGNEAEIASAQAALEAAIQAGELGKKYGIAADDIERTAKKLAESNKEISADKITEYAAAVERARRGISNAKDNFASWAQALNQANEAGKEVPIETLQQLAQTYGDILNQDPSTFSESFLSSKTNLDLMKEAIEGDADALAELQDLAREDYAIQIGIDDEDFQSKYQDIMDRWGYLDENNHIDLEAALNDEKVLTELSNLINASKMTQEQATAYLAKMGVDAEIVEQEPVEGEEEIMTQGFDTDILPKYFTATVLKNDEPYDVQLVYPDVEYTPEDPLTTHKTSTAFALKVKTAEGESGGDIDVIKQAGDDNGSNGGTSTNNNKSSKSGGSSKNSGQSEAEKAQKEAEKAAKQAEKEAEKARKEAEKKAKQEQKEKEKAAKEAAKEAEKLAKEQEKSQSSAASATSSQNKALQEQLTLFMALRTILGDISESYLAEQGIKIEFDEEGNIQNLQEVLEAAEAQRQANEDWWNSLSDEEKQQRENIDQKQNLDSQYEQMMAMLEAYEELGEQMADAASAMADAAEEEEEGLSDLVDILNDQLNRFIKVRQAEISYLQLIAKVLGDSVYQIPELMQLLFNTEGRSQYQNYLEMGEKYWSYYNSAKAMWGSGMTQEQFEAAAEKARDGIAAQVEALVDMNDQMKEFYSTTLSKSSEEMAKLTDQMAHQAAVLEHLRNLFSLMGRETDYGMLDILFKGSVSMQKNALDVSTEYFNTLYENLKSARQTYEDFIADSEMSDDAADQYKQAVLDPLIEETRKAEEQMYSDAEAFINAVINLFNNSIASAMQNVEDYFTNNLGWDYIIAAMKRASTVQEEYLTKTNQIYETNILMKKIAQDIDKANSTQVKNRLKAFSDEVLALQNQEKLNKNSLEIAKARYEVLQAQISLEEAQNAKSTVRLQRDNQGNFGYVYTANQDNVSSMESEVVEKQNDLYNLALDQMNTYSEKVISTEREKYEALKALAEEYANDSGMTEEQYQQKRQEIITSYDDLLLAQRQSYYEAFNILNEEAVENHHEAWSSDFDDLIRKGEDYEIQTIDFITNINNALEELEGYRQIVYDNASLGFDDLITKTEKYTDVNTQLRDILINKLVPALDSIMDSVDALTQNWARAFDQIMATINTYLQRIAQINSQLASLGTPISSNKTEDKGDMPIGGGGSSSLGFDPNRDYYREEIDYLAIEGNSENDAYYQDLERQRQLKVAWLESQGKESYNVPEETRLQQAAVYNYLGLSGNGDAAKELEAYFAEHPESSYPQILAEIMNDPELKKKYGLATGGYTGDWSGSDGKLAFLHKKEIVLNQKDTTNILDAVKIIRELNSNIGRQVIHKSKDPGIEIGLPVVPRNDEIMSQPISITAEFPGVTNRNEIEMAFDDLINRTSQYIQRPFSK